MQTLVVRQISSGLSLKQKSVRSRVRILKAKLVYPNAGIIIRRRPIVAIREGKRKTKAGVTAGKRKFAGAFVATPRNRPGKPQIFKRRRGQFVTRVVDGKEVKREKLEVMRISLLPQAEWITRNIIQTHGRKEFRRQMIAQLNWRSGNAR